MADQKPTPQWDIPEVLQRLRNRSKPGEPVRVQVFLNDDVPSGALGETVERLVKSADVKLGKIHKLAKSFSVQGSPDAVERIARSSDVKSILPSEIDDVYPPPRNIVEK
jgi:hypothetical protein